MELPPARELNSQKITKYAKVTKNIQKLVPKVGKNHGWRSLGWLVDPLCAPVGALFIPRTQKRHPRRAKRSQQLPKSCHWLPKLTKIDANRHPQSHLDAALGYQKSTNNYTNMPPQSYVNTIISVMFSFLQVGGLPLRFIYIYICIFIWMMATFV